MNQKPVELQTSKEFIGLVQRDWDHLTAYTPEKDLIEFENLSYLRGKIFCSKDRE